jgi:hypothetical protein
MMAPPGFPPPPSKDGAAAAAGKPQAPRAPCWFCLAGAEVEKHLVTCVGNKVYIALAKGGLTSDHVMILPIDHAPAYVGLDADIQEETDKYHEALVAYFKSQGKACISWERNVRSSHYQLQVCPIPLEAAAAAKDAFVEQGKLLSPTFRWEELDAGAKLDTLIDVGAPYMLVTLPDGSRLFHRAANGFPLQFARQVLAKTALLNMRDRIDWKRCKLPMEEEKVQRAAFRDGFKPFDFNA